MSDLVDLAATLADDTADKVIRDVDLLCLHLLWRVVMGRRGVWVRVSRYVRRSTVWSARVTGRSIGRVGGGRHALLGFDQYSADVVGCYVDGVGDTGNAENTL